MAPPLSVIAEAAVRDRLPDHPVFAKMSSTSLQQFLKSLDAVDLWVQSMAEMMR